MPELGSAAEVPKAPGATESNWKAGQTKRKKINGSGGGARGRAKAFCQSGLGSNPSMDWAFWFDNCCQSILGGRQEYFIERSKLLLVLSWFVSFQKLEDFTCKLLLCKKSFCLHQDSNPRPSCLCIIFLAVICVTTGSTLPQSVASPLWGTLSFY